MSWAVLRGDLCAYTNGKAPKSGMEVEKDEQASVKNSQNPGCSLVYVNMSRNLRTTMNISASYYMGFFCLGPIRNLWSSTLPFNSEEFHRILDK